MNREPERGTNRHSLVTLMQPAVCGSRALRAPVASGYEGAGGPVRLTALSGAPHSPHNFIPYRLFFWHRGAFHRVLPTRRARLRSGDDSAGPSGASRIQASGCNRHTSWGNRLLETAPIAGHVWLFVAPFGRWSTDARGAPQVPCRPQALSTRAMWRGPSAGQETKAEQGAPAG
jgi:hypothetical protein